jgi:hypothetical protein
MYDDLPDELLNEYDEVANSKQANKNVRRKRRVINKVQYGIPTRWPNKTIPYEFDYDASNNLGV